RLSLPAARAAPPASSPPFPQPGPSPRSPSSSASLSCPILVPLFVLKRLFRAVFLLDAVLSWRQQRHCFEIRCCMSSSSHFLWRQAKNRTAILDDPMTCG